MHLGTEESAARQIELTADALSELGSASGNTLHVGGIAADELLSEFGSPLYAFDAGSLRRRLRQVRTALGPRVDVLFACKANPNAAVARLLRHGGAGVEVASAGEILIARAAGFSGSQIQFAGPGKDADDLQTALAEQVGCLNVESEAEYQAIRKWARRLDGRPGVAVRVNPSQPVKGVGMRMGGGAEKFGVTTDDVPALVQQIVDDDDVDFLGLHVYAGTQCSDAEAWLENAAALLTLAAVVEADTSAVVRTLNFGGGFGVRYFATDSTFDLPRAGAGIQELIERDARPERHYTIELGRYLVAPAGVYLSRVAYVKESLGVRHAILDGGMHHHGAAAGIGSVLPRSFPVVHASKLRDTTTAAVSLGGPLCTPADQFGRDLALPELVPGDAVAILLSGAYGLTFSNAMFLSHPTPAEVLVDNGVAALVRRRGDAADALRGQILPAEH